jgi:hypothetical protein
LQIRENLMLPDVFILLEKLSAGTASHTEINILIKISSRIAKAYISRNYSRMSRLNEYFQANQDEIAMDAIAGLFCRDKEDKNYSIINSFNAWQPPIETKEDALYFLNKITASCVEQYLSEMLREADPVFSKIYNSVGYALRKKGYKKSMHAGCKYIVKTAEIEFNRNHIDADSFGRIPLNIFNGRDKYLDDLFDYIESAGFVPAIPLNQLVARLKNIYLNYPSRLDDSLNDNFKIDEIISFAVKEIDNFLQEKYVKKDKITPAEAGHFLSALKDMSFDLKDGGLNPGIYTYLEKYIPGLQNLDSYDKYHNILEYLLKLLKKRIHDSL